MVSGRETMLALTLKISSSTPFSGKQSPKFTRWIEAKQPAGYRAWAGSNGPGFRSLTCRADLR